MVDTTEKVGIAVVGLGVQGPVHVDWSANLANAELVAVCDVVRSRAKQLAAKYHCRWYTDYSEMLERKDIDAVIIVTPPNLHASMAVEAAKAGKHVAVEKPLCMTLKEADEMKNAVRRAGVLDCYLENLCYAPAYSTAKQIIESRGIGDPLFMRCGESDGKGTQMYSEMAKARPQKLPKKSEGESSGPGYGMLHAAGCHAIMYCRYVFDRQPVTKVYAETRNFSGSKMISEDFALLTIGYKSGQVAWVDSCNYALGSFDDRAEIYGTKGTIFIDLYGSHMTRGIKVHSQRGFDPTIGSSRYPLGRGYFGVQANWSHPIPDEEYSLGYYHEQQAFLRSVLSDRRPNINFDDGRSTLEVILAAYKSRDTGGVVSLPS